MLHCANFVLCTTLQLVAEASFGMTSCTRIPPRSWWSKMPDEPITAQLPYTPPCDGIEDEIALPPPIPSIETSKPAPPFLPPFSTSLQSPLTVPPAPPLHPAPTPASVSGNTLLSAAVCSVPASDHVIFIYFFMVADYATMFLFPATGGSSSVVYYHRTQTAFASWLEKVELNANIGFEARRVDFTMSRGEEVTCEMMVLFRCSIGVGGSSTTVTMPYR